MEVTLTWSVSDFRLGHIHPDSIRRHNQPRTPKELLSGNTITCSKLRWRKITIMEPPSFFLHFPSCTQTTGGERARWLDGRFKGVRPPPSLSRLCAAITPIIEAAILISCSAVMEENHPSIYRWWPCRAVTDTFDFAQAAEQKQWGFRLKLEITQITMCLRKFFTRLRVIFSNYCQYKSCTDAMIYKREEQLLGETKRLLSTGNKCCCLFLCVSEHSLTSQGSGLVWVLEG